MIKIGNAFKATSGFLPINGRKISDGTIVRVMEILQMNKTAEIMDQNGFRYIVDGKVFNSLFEFVDDSLIGTPGYIFAAPDEEPIMEEHNIDLTTIVEGREFIPLKSFVIRVDEDNFCVINSGIILVATRVEPEYVGFDSPVPDVSFEMSYNDILRFGLEPSESEVENERQRDSDYVLYLKAFIHVKSGGVFDMLETTYTEDELMVIATGVVDAKLERFQSKDVFEVLKSCNL